MIDNLNQISTVRSSMHFDIIHAVDPATRHQYAVKMGRQGANGGGHQERLLRNEWKATRRLTHPNLLKYHFLGRKDRLPYLVMDFAEAANLRTYLSRILPEGMKAVATRDMFAMRSWIENAVVQMITVVAFIHSRGILHLDIKPENFLVLNGTDIRLIDFSNNARYGFWGRFARPNGITGTPAYISPEQIRLEKPREASDIYSLGATIYFMLTGAPPFSGHSTQEILARHLNARPVPLADIIPGLRRPFGLMVDKMLAKNANDRLANLAMLKNEIIQNGIFPHLAR
ncbi:MAG: serine/threonine-protein kinase [Planctomycetota bacterium]